MSNPQSIEAAAAGKTGPGGKRKLLIIATAALVLGGGIGAGAYWWTRPAAEHADTAVPLSDRGIVKFEPFVVNLADRDASRFLRVSVQLIVRDAGQAAEVAEQPVLQVQARAAVLEQLTLQTSDVLVTPDGKAALRTAIAERVTAALPGVEVIDVLFSDFVVQF